MSNDLEILPLVNPNLFLSLSKFEPIDLKSPIYTYSTGLNSDMDGPFYIGSEVIRPFNDDDKVLAPQLLAKLINGAYKLTQKRNLLVVRTPVGPVYNLKLDFSSLSSPQSYNNITMKFIAGCKIDPLFQRILIYIDELNVDVETLSTWHMLYGCIEIFEKKLLKGQWDKKFDSERSKLGNTANNIGFPLGRHSVAHSAINSEKTITPIEGIEIIEMLSKKYLGL